VVLYNRFHTESDGSPSKTWIEKEVKVDDLNDALEHPIKLTHNLSDLNGAYAMVITAGATRKEGESRADLARKNAHIMKEYVPIITANPECLVMVISNPVDGLTHYLIDNVAKTSNKRPIEIAKKIIGISYVDTTRLRNLVREFIAKNYPSLKDPEIKCLVLGEHGPTMVPLVSQVTINGKLLQEFARVEQIEHIVKGVVTRGNDIIVRTGTSAIAGPSIAVINMIKAMSTNQIVQFPCSVFDGHACIGRLVAFEGNRVKEIITDVPMSNEEKEKILLSEKALAKQYEEITSLTSATPQQASFTPANTAAEKTQESPTYQGSLDRILKAFNT
jgi:malate dehydrogenase